MEDWNGIIGHRRQIDMLRRSVARGRGSHAYLLVGRPGLGKSLVSRVLARALLCEAADGAERPCGTCRSCLAEPDAHPDWRIVVPDGASIKIEQVREAQRDLPYRPAWGVRRVICFDPADAMTEQAQNSLLKSLEDPPRYAVFILVAHQIGGVLPTIRSRCTQVRFSGVPAAEIAGALQARGMEAETAELVAALAFGRPAVALHEDEAALRERREKVLGWTEHLRRGPAPLWHVGDALEGEKEEVEAYLDMLLLWYRDLLLASCGVPPEAWVNRDQAERVREEAENVSPAGAVAALEAILRLKEHLHRNAGFRLAVDVALARVRRGVLS